MPRQVLEPDIGVETQVQEGELDDLVAAHDHVDDHHRPVEDEAS